MKCLTPVSRWHVDRMVWQCELACLLLVPGRYCSLIEWAEVGPITRQQCWTGIFNKTAGMAEITAYLTANGITVHDTDDLVIWACQVACEMLERVESNGGNQNPQTQGIYTPMRQDLRLPTSPDFGTYSLEWYEREVCQQGGRMEDIPPMRLHEEVPRDESLITRFGVALIRYNVPHISGPEVCT